MAIELIQNATAEYENHPTGGQAYTLDWTRQVFGPIGIVGIIFNLLIVITVSKLEMNKGSAITSSFRDPNKRENFITLKLMSSLLIPPLGAVVKWLRLRLSIERSDVRGPP